MYPTQGTRRVPTAKLADAILDMDTLKDASKLFDLGAGRNS
jgi:hypothetical protein